MPTLFFEDMDLQQKIRFDIFGHSKTMKPVRTKAINDIRFLTPPHADFDARRPAYREDEQYGENKAEPLRFTDQQKVSLRNATALALKIVDDGYGAMCNYLRFRHDPDNAHVVYFKKRVKAWFGDDTQEIIAVVTAHMREMTDILQAPETFITFVNMENQRDISCKSYGRKIYGLDMPDALVYTHLTNFKKFIITMLSENASGRVWRGLGCGVGIRLYITKLCFTYHINRSARMFIHELSHKILMSDDSPKGEQGIYGAQACKALAARDPDQAVTIADNWAMFYMSFGCYPGQEEYAYQDEYEIKACDKGLNRPRILKKFNISKKCQTIEELEELDAMAARNELKSAKALRALNAHISRRVYLDTPASCGELGHEKQGYQARKELSYLKARMEYRESLTNLASKTDEEVNKLKKQAQEMAHLEAMDSRDARARRQRIQRLARLARK